MKKEDLEKAGIDYEQGVKRFMGNPKIFERFLYKFLDDKSYEGLKDSLWANNCEAAFKEAHTLKGLASNLSMSGLMRAVANVTEKLRNGDIDAGRMLMDKVDEQYNAICDILRNSQSK